MNSTIIRITDMLESLGRYFLDRPLTPPIVRATTAQGVVTATVTALRAAAQNQSSGLGGFTGAVRTREFLLKQLRALLRDINRTGRILDKDHPGLAGTFRLPRNKSALQLLAQAEAIEAAATEFEPTFLAAGLPASFLTELADLIDSYRDATSQKQDGRIQRGGGTAALRATAKVGIQAAIELDMIVRNHFRNDPEALGAWKIARHIERTSRRTATPGTPSLGGDGGTGTGSGTA